MVSGLIGTVMAGVNVGCNDRMKSGYVEDGGRPAVWLLDMDYPSNPKDGIK